MPTRRLGLLTSTCLLLATAAQADPAPVAPALFQPIEVRVDAVLLAANLAAVDLAVALGPDQCEDDALDGRPEPAAVSLEPAETANVAPDAEPQPEASIRDGDRDPDTQEEAQPALSKADPAMDTAEATGSAMASAYGVVKGSPADTKRGRGCRDGQCITGQRKHSSRSAG